MKKERTFSITYSDPIVIDSTNSFTILYFLHNYNTLIT